MLIVLLNWVWIFLSTFILGFSLLKAIKKNYKEIEFDICILSGLVIITVYAQLFSLFYKVGLWANAILFVLVFILITYNYKTLKLYLKLYKFEKKDKLIIVGMIVLLIFTIQSPKHYDTYLYHAQSIRWIEEYGIVKGLGNLHNRFAYNSAFFPLQAIFSWKFFLGQSLHAVNGFFCVVIIGYVIRSIQIFQNGKVQLSVFWKAIIIYYMCSNLTNISSPGTDLIPMLMVLYILSKWSDYLTEDKKDIDLYATLSIFIVWIITIKLSVAAIILLALYPFFLLVKQRNWKRILSLVAIGCIIILPFILRNVVISGYFVYPYANIDIFSVDWKMPKSLVQYDSNEIMAWGRTLNDVNKIDMSLKEWVPVWFSKLSKSYQLLVYINVILCLGTPLLILYEIFVNKEIRKSLWAIISIVNLMVWFLTAPLIRYGVVYLFLLPCIFASLILDRINGKKLIKIILIMFTIVCVRWILIGATRIEKITVCMQEDYQFLKNKEVIWYNYKIYIPMEGDQTGYHYFPSTPYEEKLRLIEPRGMAWRDGIRTKKEYINKNITTDAVVLEY